MTLRTSAARSGRQVPLGEPVPSPPEEDAGDHEEEADPVLGQLLERGESSLVQGVWEHLPPVDAGEHHGGVTREHERRDSRVEPPADDERGGDQRDGEEEPGGQPELGRRIQRAADHAEAGVVGEVHDVQRRDRDQGGPEKDREVVVQELTQRHGHDDDREADDHEDDLRQRVEEDVGLQPCEVEKTDEGHGDDHGQSIRARQCDCPVLRGRACLARDSTVAAASGQVGAAHLSAGACDARVSGLTRRSNAFGSVPRRAALALTWGRARRCCRRDRHEHRTSSARSLPRLFEASPIA